MNQKAATPALDPPATPSNGGVATAAPAIERSTMSAVVQDSYGSPDVLVLREVARPAVATSEVLVRVRAAGVNIADWAITAGLPFIARPVYGLRTPKNPIRGTDVAGVVDAVGAAVTRFNPGDRVFGWCKELGGAFAEFASVPEAALQPIPAAMTFEQAAAAPMAGCVALKAVRDVGSVEPGQRVLVNGASGGIGTFAVQIAKGLGAHVTGVCSAKNANLVRSLGADEVIDYGEQDFTETGERYDFILDNVANHPLSRLTAVLTPTGTLVPNGGQFENHWFAGAGRVIRARMSSRSGGRKLLTFVLSPKTADLDGLRNLMQTGTVTPAIDGTYPLANAAQAVARVGGGHARGKVVVTM
ncbi:MAG: NAD(P)-dependent alcohol dehydrogenase [Candidatus Dormibacteria bacterium]